MTVYTMKMAGVFINSSCTLALRTGIFPRWMAYLRVRELQERVNKLNNERKQPAIEPMEAEATA